MGKLRSVPVLALCAVYLFLAAGVALLSSGVYRTVQEEAELHARQRVAISYVLSQLRAGDTKDAMRIVPFGDGDALAIADGPDYETLLYCHEGYLMELYAERDLGLEPSAGMQIVEAESLKIILWEDAWWDGVLSLCVVDKSGNVSQTNYHVKSGEVAE